MRAFTATLTALCIAGLLTTPVLADEVAATTAGVESATAADAVTSNVDNKTAIADGTGADANSSDAAKTESSSDDNGKGSKKKLAQNKKDPKPKKDPAAKPAKPASTAKSGSKVDLGTRLASFTVCTIIGAPIALTRRTAIEMAQGNHDLIGDADTWWKKVGVVFPGFLCVPYGAVSGGASGTMYCLKNAWVNSGTEPFSKDAMSLGDIGN